MTTPRKLSPPACLLLLSLADDSQAWQHGYELLKRTGLKSGTLYPLLIRLSEQGLMEAEWQAPAEPGRPPRHAYRLTRSGLRAAAEVAANSESKHAGRAVTA